MRNEGLVKTQIAGAAIGAYKIVKPGAAADTVVQAAAATDKSIGVSDLGAPSGDRVDVIIDGIARVVYGGTVAYGDPLTSDASGNAVAAAPAAGANVRIIGIAMVAGVAGDIGAVRLSPSVMQG